MRLLMPLARLSRATYLNAQRTAEHVCSWGQKFLVRVYYNHSKQTFIATEVDSAKDRFLERMIVTGNKNAYRYSLVGTYSDTASYQDIIDDMIHEVNLAE